MEPLRCEAGTKCKVLRTFELKTAHAKVSSVHPEKGLLYAAVACHRSPHREATLALLGGVGKVGCRGILVSVSGESLELLNWFLPALQRTLESGRLQGYPTCKKMHPPRTLP